jgi:negative regulator of flagellin synthesis FlgM
MKINENGRINSLQAYQKNNVNPKTAKGEKSASRDAVTISSEALEMARENFVNTEQRARREEKVAQIKQSVQDGTYEIDARNIAEAILKNLLGE